jgi:hypothetical protein
MSADAGDRSAEIHTHCASFKNENQHIDVKSVLFLIALARSWSCASDATEAVHERAQMRAEGTPRTAGQACLHLMAPGSERRRNHIVFQGHFGICGCEA